MMVGIMKPEDLFIKYLKCAIVYYIHCLHFVIVVFQFSFSAHLVVIQNTFTVDSRLSAVMVGRIGADNQNHRINRSTHTQA
jgi:hypothetical protein